jgi:multiple sugar transport system substrate-binding protein
VLLYNKDMFDAAGLEYPPTWPPLSVDQFVADSCALTDPGKGVWGSAYGDPVTWLQWETLVSPDGTTASGYVNGPVSVHVHEELARGIVDGCAPSLNVMDPWEEGQDFFTQGKLAMVAGGFEGLNKIENAGIDYGVAGLPTPEGVEPFFNVWSDGMAIFASSEHVDAAKQLVTFLATDGQRIRADAGDFPLDSTVAQESGWTKGVPGREEGVELLQHARGAIFIPNRWDTFGPIFDAFGFITSGDKTAKEALDDAAPAIDENLEKAWRIWDST